ncbi:MAG: hypothetical protein JST93_04595 [Acidobacteria bacterium]|nr:hypothetical protein [Acidobacteriota bacterium]
MPASAREPVASTPIRVLIIENHPDGVADLPGSEPSPHLEILRAHSLSEGIFFLNHIRPDWILLDPNCQSSSPNDLLSFLRHAAGIPMQVVAGAPTPELLNADIPDATTSDSSLQARVGSLAASVARHAQHRHSREAAPAPAHTHAPRLRHHAPGVFHHLSGVYHQALTTWVRELPYSSPDRNAPLEALVQRLEELRAHPRDVVELHLAAMRAILATASSKNSQLYLKEGQTLLLKVMGRLATHYLQSSTHPAVLTTP